MASTDKRIHGANNLFRNIRTVKYFVWEHHFSTVVNSARIKELKSLRRRFILWAAAETAWYAVPTLFTVLSFLCYTILEGKILRPSLAFASISMFSLLRIPLGNLGHVLAQVKEAGVSLRRIEDFLEEGEDECVSTDNTTRDVKDDATMGFQHAHFSWGKGGTGAFGASSAFELRDLDFCFQTEKLNVIIGPTGSGKTSLLLALLGEMRLMEGRVFLPSTR